MHPDEGNIRNDLNHKEVFQDKVTPFVFPTIKLQPLLPNSLFIEETTLQGLNYFST